MPEDDLKIDLSPAQASTVRMATAETATSAQEEAQQQAYEDQQAAADAARDDAELNEALRNAEKLKLQSGLDSSRKLTKLARAFFVVALVIGVTMISYFAFLRTGGFGAANLTLQEAQGNRVELEAEYNYRIYKLVDQEMESLTWLGLEYLAAQQISKSSLVTAVDQQRAVDQADYLRAQLTEKFTKLTEILQSLSFIDADDAREQRSELIIWLEAKEDLGDKEQIINQMRNKELFDLASQPAKMQQIDALDNDLYAAWLSQFLIQARTAESSLVQLYNDRLLWSEVIDAIEVITRQIDPNFGGSDQFIQYTAYNFNSRNKQLTVTGQIRTEDSLTFTRIANLIDYLIAYQTDQGVKPFMNVKTRSFTKNELQESDDPESFYQATLKLDFELADLRPDVPGSIAVDDLEAVAESDSEAN